MHSTTFRPHRRGALRPGVLTLALALAAGACDTESLLEVPDPDVVAQPVFADPDNLAAVRAGVIREFARAYAGQQNNEGGQILMSGLLADELYSSDNFSDRGEIDARDITTSSNLANETAFFWLQRARNHAEQGAGLFAASDEAGSAGHAELLTLAGYTYNFFGENYCSGVPFSTIPFTGGEQVFGDPRSTEEIFGLALTRFDQASALAPADEVTNLLRVGRARALLNLGRYSEAASAASAVPTSFAYLVSYTDAVQDAWNGVWNLVNGEKRWSASFDEGENGLPFIASGDPRVPGEFTGPGFNQSVEHYAQLKYPSAGTDIVLASGIEARLIEAEAELQAGDRAGFFAIHNALRTAAGLEALEDVGQTMAELVDLHFEERAYWLWLSSHRLGDLRRLLRQYDRSAGEVYPVGLTVRGAARGNDVTLSVPFTETNNPNYQESDCDPTQP